jgi:hypothetical protein
MRDLESDQAASAEVFRRR